MSNFDSTYTESHMRLTNLDSVVLIDSIFLSSIKILFQLKYFCDPYNLTIFGYPISQLCL